MFWSKPKAPSQLSLLEQIAVGQRCVKDLNPGELACAMRAFKQSGTLVFPYETWCEVMRLLTDEARRRRQVACGVAE